jgi:hypothetical protein
VRVQETLLFKRRENRALEHDHLNRATLARQAFGDARRELATRGMAYDAALISLELAVLLIDEGETAEVRN